MLKMIAGLCLLAAAQGAMPPSMGRWGQVMDTDTPSVVNCTWKYFTQKLDHFGNSSYTYKERYCLYDKFWKPATESGFKNTADQAPIFFYTGNESPVEEYVNNTGLMWQLGEKMNALLIFAEHRYEGLSVPQMHGMTDCITYCTTSQALADYAALIKSLKEEYKTSAPVIAFGGSYGGMLAGWMRIKYPEVISGSIAASAPVSGFPSIGGKSGLSASSDAVGRGLSAKGGATDTCFSNLRSTWPLLHEVAKTPYGLETINKAARRCDLHSSASSIANWGQGPWFNMAEGDYPFPSTYITFSVGPGYYPLPAWPMRVACSKGLNNDMGVKVTGNVPNVDYSIKMGDIDVQVDWDKLTGNGATLTKEQIDASGVFDLVRAMTDAASVWYNITADKPCYGAADTDESERTEEKKQKGDVESGTCESCPVCDGCPPCPLCNKQPPKACTWEQKPVAKTFAWGPVCCNEDLNLANTDVQGVGGDIFWPPNVQKDYTLESVIGPHTKTPGCYPEYNAQGLYGSPLYSDRWSNWITAYYDSANVDKYTNIVWSNGALDPWSGAGVYPPGGSALGPMVQNITEDGSSVALVIDLGGHHLDLFFSTPQDPPSATQVRLLEEQKIREWSQQHYDSL